MRSNGSARNSTSWAGVSKTYALRIHETTRSTSWTRKEVCWRAYTAGSWITLALSNGVAIHGADCCGLKAILARERRCCFAVLLMNLRSQARITYPSSSIKALTRISTTLLLYYAVSSIHLLASSRRWHPICRKGTIKQADFFSRI